MCLSFLLTYESNLNVTQKNTGCLAFLFNLFGSSKSSVATVKPEQPATQPPAQQATAKPEPLPDKPLPYGVRNHFLSKAEMEFFDALHQAISKQAVICPKVRLGDIFYVPDGVEKVYYNRISHKHVDFLLCDPKNMRPIVGVELDDSSHEQRDRQERDNFVDDVFAAADLPIIHIPAKREYSADTLLNEIQPHLLAVRNAPICPKCGARMVARTAKKGANVGSRFYGCINYPDCRETKPI